MRKVKFTQDSFDEKLGAILTEFPMLDVRLNCLAGKMGAEIDTTGPPPFSIFSDERSLRQKSLQARPRTTPYMQTSHRSSRKRLCPASKIRRLALQM